MLHVLATTGASAIALGAGAVIVGTMLEYREAIATALGLGTAAAPAMLPARRVRVRAVTRREILRRVDPAAARHVA